MLNAGEVLSLGDQAGIALPTLPVRVNALLFTYSIKH